MPTIRPFRSDDLDPLHRISLATGHAGGDASHLHVDPKLMGHIYVDPYALLEPTSALIVEDGDGVAGFAVGTTLLDRWTNVASSRGAKALHVAVNRANNGATSFWGKMGFVDLAPDELPEGRTLWMDRP